jgi:hypothetical protein
VQDGRWWRATVQRLSYLDGARFGTEAAPGDVPRDIPGDVGGAIGGGDGGGGIAPTLVLQLIARPHAAPLRVRRL